MYYEDRYSSYGDSLKDEVETFAAMVKGKIENRGYRALPEHDIQFHVLGSERPERLSDVRKERTTTITADDKELGRVLNAVRELDNTRQQLDYAIKKIEAIDQENREFHEFFAQNPELREKYRELMTMCKLAGLRKIPEKLL